MFSKKPEPEPTPTPQEEHGFLDKIEAYRVEEFLRLGFSESVALEFAVRREIDLHQARRMLARGCPLSTAYRILS